MATTFLEYLTRQNPIPDATNCGEGYSTKSTANYGPNKVRPWEDITLENLKASFFDVLEHTMEKPRVETAQDVRREKTILFEEESITTLAVDWNEPVVQHALSGTQKILCDSQPNSPFHRGEIHFMRNTGQGHIKNRKGRKQKPDWCVFLRGEEGMQGPVNLVNLVPGDSKPAKKWNSEWIKSPNITERRKAKAVLQQIVKYMYLAKTRYGFILSEQELVPMRLSRFVQSEDATKSQVAQKHRERQLMDSSGRFSGDEDGANDGPKSDVSNDEAPGVDKTSPGVSNATGYLLEYGQVPWSLYGRDSLTINLTLWWLPILAVQCASIKQNGMYTPLSERNRGNSPEYIEPQRTTKSKEADVEKRGSSGHKRRHDDAGAVEPITRSRKTRRGSAYPRASNAGSLSRTRSGGRGASFREERGRTTKESASSKRQSRASRAASRRKHTPTPESSDGSADDSSEATNEYEFSFSRSFTQI
jgi:hypothetical protein